jgi:hypothetical protein
VGKKTKEIVCVQETIDVTVMGTISQEYIPVRCNFEKRKKSITSKVDRVSATMMQHECNMASFTLIFSEMKAVARLLLLLLLAGISAIAVNGQATSDTALALTNSVSVRGFVSEETYAYYTFTPASATQLLTIVVTPLGDGDPDLYVSTTSQTFPTKETYDAASLDFGEDSVNLYDVAASTTIRIAVYGWRNSSFTIVATSENGKTFLLLLGS